MDISDRKNWPANNKWLSLEELIDAWRYDFDFSRQAATKKIIEMFYMSPKEYSPPPNWVNTDKLPCSLDHYNFILMETDRLKKYAAVSSYIRGDSHKGIKDTWLGMQGESPQINEYLNTDKVNKINRIISNKEYSCDLFSNPLILEFIVENCGNGRVDDKYLVEIFTEYNNIRVYFNDLLENTNDYDCELEAHKFIMVAKDKYSPGVLPDALEIDNSTNVLRHMQFNDIPCEVYYKQRNSTNKLVYSDVDIFFTQNVDKPMAFINPTGFAEYIRKKGFIPPPLLEGKEPVSFEQRDDPYGLVNISHKVKRYIYTLDSCDLSKIDPIKMHKEIQLWIKNEAIKKYSPESKCFIYPDNNDIQFIISNLGELRFFAPPPYDPCGVIALGMEAHRYFSSLDNNPLDKLNFDQRVNAVFKWAKQSNMLILGRNNQLVTPAKTDAAAIVSILTSPTQRKKKPE